MLKLFIILFFVFFPINAVRKDWNSLNGGVFHNDAFWTPAGQPGGLDAAFINQKNPNGNFVYATQLVNASSITLGPNPLNILISNTTVVADSITINDQNLFATDNDPTEVVLVKQINNFGELETHGSFLSNSVIYNKAPNGLYRSYGNALVAGVFNYANFGIYGRYQALLIDNYYFLLVNHDLTLNGGADFGSNVWGVDQFDYSITNINSDFTVQKKALLQLTNQTEFYMTTDVDSVNERLLTSAGDVEASNSLLHLNRTQYYQLMNSTNTFNNSYFMMERKSVYNLQDNSISTFQSNTVMILDGSILLNNKAKIDIIDSSCQIQGETNLVGLFGDSSLRLSNSTFNTTQHAGFVTYNNSDIVFEDNSFFLMNGSYLMDHNSSLTIKNSKLIQLDQFLGAGTSQMKAYESGFGLFGKLNYYNDSSLQTFNSNVTVYGAIAFLDNSTFYFDNTLLYTGLNFMTDKDTNGYFVDSQIVARNCIFNGNATFQNSSVLVYEDMFVGGGVLTSNNSFMYLNSSLNIGYGGKFLLNSSVVLILTQSIVVLDSTFSAENTVIRIESGSLYYTGASSVSLKNTTLLNTNGVIVASSDLYIYEGTSLSNNAKFDLSSNIYPANSASNLKISNQEQGILNVESKHSFIQVGLENAGKINIANNATMFNYTQTSGSLKINGGVVNSSNPLSIQGGSVAGSGTIETSVENAGSIGSATEVTKFQIVGNFTQSADGKIVLTINSEDEIPLIDISEVANLNGTLVIRVANTINNKSLTLMSYGSSIGGFSNTELRVFNPKTGEDVDHDKCQYKVNQGQTSMSMLVGRDSCTGDVGSFGNSKLSSGAIAGIVVGGVVVAAVIGGFILHKTNRIPKSMRLSHRLKSLQKEVDAAEADKA
ncbi:hypothetical protein PPL_11156 [Heterostelium album PN500]|uniref:Uncharacterized protein n=1 Tax=Heterostelium pallidum (strain ATCC 26659 / Pp 5 / PN500) TaxID=670386 RepID=D3BTP6_HETP5|nr:hypothetical protein PPL_11156 [Heterostelium album PN500]EFA75082.1 hypothetical protein PPL_11156 [Heterostelium album PN500]|eukprot:XP_020427216.1 hypothetical protein PPL_11156 [Heterostelium album PN500]